MVSLRQLNSAQDEIGLVQGQTPEGKEDYWAARWLEAHRLSYDYQYTVPGLDYSIDFFIYTRPLATMLSLDRSHWHADELDQDERKRQIDIEEAMRDIARVPMTIIWAGEMASRDALEVALAQELLNG